MKKLLAALALAGLASTTFAQTQASVDLQNQRYENGSPDQQQIALNVKRKVTDLLSVDGQVQLAQNDNSATASKAYKTSGRYEAGITAQQAMFGPVDVYGRLALGEKASSGTDRFTYHSEEVGVVYNAPYSLHFKVGYRTRDTFKDGMGDTAKTNRFAVTYDINKNNSIVYRYDINHADSANGGNSKANAIQYVAKF